MSSSSDIAIKVHNVSKTFKLPHEKQTSLKSAFLKSFQKKSYETQQALKNIDFEIKKGEFFGIVGRNGSGKSTLLKCIAGVYTPTTGSIKVNGTLVPFIELGVGFNPELTGRDNVYMNGALLGFSRKQMEAMYEEIVEFAELGNFMDQKLKNYSSGMQVRLAFSIAIRAKGDILLIDEVLAVGDAAFQQKCLDHFSSLKRSNKTIILVTHSMATIEQFCDRAMLIEDSEVQAIGSSTDIAGKYEEMFLKEEAQKAEKKPIIDEDKTIMVKNGSIKLQKTSFEQGSTTTRAIKAFEPFSITFDFISSIDLPHGVIGVNIQTNLGQVLFSEDTKNFSGGKYVSFKKNKKTTLTIELDNILTNGAYYIVLKVADGDNPSDRPILHNRRYTKFTVFGVKSHVQSLTHPKRNVTWK